MKKAPFENGEIKQCYIIDFDGRDSVITFERHLSAMATEGDEEEEECCPPTCDCESDCDCSRNQCHGAKPTRWAMYQNGEWFLLAGEHKSSQILHDRQQVKEYMAKQKVKRLLLKLNPEEKTELRKLLEQE